jgi:hypothetical protein
LINIIFLKKYIKEKIITMANKKETTTKSKWFFGWQNIKFGFRELINIYSSKDSYFSKKRIESGLAFIIAQWGMIFFLMENHSTLTMGEFLLWAAAEFAVSGYIINKIQSEKKVESDATSDSTSSDESPM